MENDYSIGIYTIMVIGTPIMVACSIWLFEWYLIGVTLMLGGKSMADKKAKDLDFHLAFLERDRERLQ